MLTVSSPQDLETAEALFERLVEAPLNDTLPNLRISYLVYLKDSPGDQPNAYLNLARLISQTNHLVLFPKPLLELHPAVAYSHFQNATNLHSRNTPVVLTASRKHSEFPFSPFSPLMVHREDTTWCDERFDSLSSSSVAWEECLWQFWITKRGGIQPIVSRNTWKMILDTNQTTVRPASSVSSGCPFLSHIFNRPCLKRGFGTTSATRSVYWPSETPSLLFTVSTIVKYPRANNSDNQYLKNTRIREAG